MLACWITGSSSIEQESYTVSNVSWVSLGGTGLLFLAAFHVFLPCSHKKANLQILCKYWIYSNGFVECSSLPG